VGDVKEVSKTRGKTMLESKLRLICDLSASTFHGTIQGAFKGIEGSVAKFGWNRESKSTRKLQMSGLANHGSLSRVSRGEQIWWKLSNMYIYRGSLILAKVSYEGMNSYKSNHTIWRNILVGGKVCLSS
jgi:hypothetical protein